MAAHCTKRVASWRVQEAEPSGCTMWFDPTREVPMLRDLPPDQREPHQDSEPFGLTMELSEEREVETPEGGAAKMSETDGCDLPF